MFNRNQETDDQIEENLKKKINEFFSWYSRFNNATAIQYVQIISNNFGCATGCQIKADYKFSIIDVLVPKSVVVKHLQAAAKKYNMEVKLVEME